MTKICVTGGAGFIGTHIVRKLITSNYEVTVLDNLSVGRRENIPAEARFVAGDILKECDVIEAFSGCDVVVHLAARVAIRSSIEKVFDDASTNYAGTAQVLNVLQKSANIRKIIFASSMAVYGDATSGETLNEHDSRLEPLSPYGVSKLASEKIIQLISDSKGIEHSILRFFNTYGPGQSLSPYVGVMTIFANRLLQNKVVDVYGDGFQLRDYVFVEDVANAVAACVDSHHGDSRVVNVGSGIGTTIWQLIKYFESALGRNIPFQKMQPIPGEMRNSVADCKRLHNILKITPRNQIAESLPDILREIETQTTH